MENKGTIPVMTVEYLHFYRSDPKMALHKARIDHMSMRTARRRPMCHRYHGRVD